MFDEYKEVDFNGVMNVNVNSVFFSTQKYYYGPAQESSLVPALMCSQIHAVAAEGRHGARPLTSDNGLLSRWCSSW